MFRETIALCNSTFASEYVPLYKISLNMSSPFEFVPFKCDCITSLNATPFYGVF